MTKRALRHVKEKKKPSMSDRNKETMKTKSKKEKNKVCVRITPSQLTQIKP